MPHRLPESEAVADVRQKLQDTSRAFNIAMIVFFVCVVVGTWTLSHDMVATFSFTIAAIMVVTMMCKMVQLVLLGFASSLRPRD